MCKLKLTKFVHRWRLVLVKVKIKVKVKVKIKIKIKIELKLTKFVHRWRLVSAKVKVEIANEDCAEALWWLTCCFHLNVYQMSTKLLKCHLELIICY